MRPHKLIATTLVLLVCIGAVGAGRYFWGPHGTVTMSRALTAKSKGDPKSPVWAVEFFDLQCSSCGLVHAWLKEYMREHEGRVYLQAHFHPIDKHRHGLESAVYAECASRQGRFWEFTDTVFERQAEWAELPDISERFRGYARTAGLSAEKLDACVRDPRVAELIIAQRAENEKTGVQGTPSFYINGKFVVGVRDALYAFALADGLPEETYFTAAQQKEREALGLK